MHFKYMNNDKNRIGGVRFLIMYSGWFKSNLFVSALLVKSPAENPAGSRFLIKQELSARRQGANRMFFGFRSKPDQGFLCDEGRKILSSERGIFPAFFHAERISSDREIQARNPRAGPMLRNSPGSVSGKKNGTMPRAIPAW